MNNLSLLVKKEDKNREQKKQFVRVRLEQWLRMEDIEEIIILGKIENNEGMREFLPGAGADRIWWVGALESAKFALNSMIQGTEEDYLEEGEEDGE